MAEAPAAKKKPKKKVSNPKGAAAPQRPVEDAPFGWRTWATVGFVLVVGVVGWKLLGASYKHDVETICNAEKGAGLSVDKELSKVTQWVREHLGTPEGNELYSALNDAKVAERPKRLQDEADKLHVAPCPLVQSLQALAATADARSDVAHLCSSMTFPKLYGSEDIARLSMLETWIEANAKSPRTKELGEQLRQAPAGPERAKVLRDAAAKLDTYSCENAKSLEKPPPPVPTGVPVVRLYTDMQINGGMREEDAVKSLADVNPQLLDCYKKGLERKPDLTGRITVKLQIDMDGKVSKDGPGEGSSLSDQDTLMCMVKVVRGMRFPKNPGPMVSVMMPLELTHAEK